MKTLIKDIMISEVVTVEATTSFNNLVKTMSDNRLSHIIVLDDDGTVAGIISTKDIMDKLLSLSTATSGKHYTQKMMNSFRAIDIMSTPVITISDTASYAYAHKLLSFYRIHALIVTDNDNRLKGILTYYDLVKALIPMEQLENTKFNLSIN